MNPLEQLTAALADRYRVERELGAGGMATVYLAEDLKHDRKVAIKVLRPELAAVLGAERFVQEIKTTANLQHPHILPLFDSGQADRFLYYVMPYTEGETLRDKLNREKQLGIAEAVKITTEVADALGYAHRNNVIHRDIKPENILLHDGRPVVADFGIALAVSAAGGTRLTETGLSVGTPQYMSPEQAMGDRELDGRSDIYSLGCVAYEMLTGEPPHTGPTAQAIVAKILTDDAKPVSATRKTVPTHVDLSIQKALAKLPADRFQSAAEFTDGLTNPGSATLKGVAGTVPTGAIGLRRMALDPRLLLPALAVGIAIGVGIGWWMHADGAEDPAPARFAIATQPKIDVFIGSALAVSPDGQQIVYVGQEFASPGSHIDDYSKQMLYLRVLGDLEASVIPGTEDANNPFFSPDGEWIGYIAGNKLMKVAVSGGPPVLVAEASAANVRGASWGTNDVIVFSPRGISGLMRISAAGGVPEVVPVTGSTTEPVALRWPEMLPGGEAVLVTVWTGDLERAQVGVLSLRNGELKPLITGTRASYVPGYLVFARGDGSLLAATFDLKRLEVTGPAVPIVQGLRVYTGGAAQYSVSPNGTLAYRPQVLRDVALVMVDRQGSLTRLPETRPYGLTFPPRFAPNGERIAVTIRGNNDDDVWIYDVSQNTVTPLATEGVNWAASWTPDGSRITFATHRAGRESGGQDLYWQPADGSGPAEPLVADSLEQWESDWSPDGRSLAFSDVSEATGGDIRLLRLDGNGVPELLIGGEHDQRRPAIAPDGSRVAYTSNESGREEVYVQQFPGGGGKVQVSRNGGLFPRWAPDGSELFYLSGDELTAARISTDAGFRVLGREVLYTSDRHISGFDVHPDGDRFVMVRLEESEPSDLVIVLNWLSEVRERIGALSGER